MDGYQWDNIAEMWYAKARYYNSDLGRFVAEDPLKGSITDIQTLNLYPYVKNNPLKYVDPDGRKHEIGGPVGNGSINNKPDYLGEDLEGIIEGNGESIDYLYADEVRDKLLKDGFSMYMETDGYDAGKVVKDLITNGYEYAAGEVAVATSKKLIPQFAKFVSGVGYVLTAKEAIDIVEELRLTGIVDKHSGAKIEAYSYSVENIMDSDEASGTIAHHVNKNVLLITNSVDEID